MKFADLPFRPEILEAIQEIGYDSPTPIQEQAIPVILEGKDVIGSAQTGTGKTAAFALPTIQRLGEHGKCRCLAIGPTRELAAQVEENFRAYGKHLDLRITLLHGGVGYGKQKEDLARGMDVIVATPGRLLDHVQQGTASLNDVEILILDEVDRMLDMGFIEDVRKIVKKCSKKGRQTLLFSATVPDTIQRLANWALKDPVNISIGQNLSPASTVKHEVYPVNAMQKFDLLVSLLNQFEAKNTLIFCRMRRGSDRVARWLMERGFNVGVIHSDLSQKDRTKALEKFKKGEIPILVATDIASRGLDIADVTHVVNYDVPQHAEDYVHRIGRTGRAKREGNAVTLQAPDETSALMAIESYIKREVPKAKLEGFAYRYDPLEGVNQRKTRPKRRNR
ncbi:MAG: DEAD/DEAH box helicase [Verrucomicrobiota bacterium]